MSSVGLRLRLPGPPEPRRAIWPRGAYAARAPAKLKRPAAALMWGRVSPAPPGPGPGPAHQVRCQAQGSWRPEAHAARRLLGPEASSLSEARACAARSCQDLTCGGLTERPSQTMI